MKYIDVSKVLYGGMAKYPSDPDVKITNFKSLRKRNSCNVSLMTMGSHAGTHVDAPCHVLDKAGSVDDIGIEKLICRVEVIAIKSFLSKKYPGTNHGRIRGVLFKTDKKHRYLTERAAGRIIKAGMTLVGTEEMSVEEPANKAHLVHKTLLRNGVTIVENLNLRGIKPGRYGFICLPLRIKKGDGAPARAVLSL